MCIFYYYDIMCIYVYRALLSCMIHIRMEHEMQGNFYAQQQTHSAPSSYETTHTYTCIYIYIIYIYDTQHRHRIQAEKMFQAATVARPYYSSTGFAWMRGSYKNDREHAAWLGSPLTMNLNRTVAVCPVRRASIPDSVPDMDSIAAACLTTPQWMTG